ncbi:MAG: TIGR02444 family protein [Alphaproteobacteria bacterium]|nr:TIGR02444 family protein [Alphaproteobacteria bacterium]MBV9150889.1 TIGR02444 family protein [Alphaproteobacteria bacterium]MBV9584577.1 TIGR02444 family protein [Alphaproteobacteria bacterium]
MRQQKRGKLRVSGEAFWRFSLVFYACPGVAEALIALQDRAQLDVNLILFALWHGVVHGHRLEEAELRAAEAAAAPLHREVVTPLRALRRGLKPSSDPDIQGLRRRVAALELAAERHAQSRLAATISPATGENERGAAAQANLALYLGAEMQSTEAAVLRQALDGLMNRS